MAKQNRIYLFILLFYLSIFLIFFLVLPLINIHGYSFGFIPFFFFFPFFFGRNRSRNNNTPTTNKSPGESESETHETDRSTYYLMQHYAHKARWFNMRYRVLYGWGKIRNIRISPITFKVGALHERWEGNSLIILISKIRRSHLLL